MSDAPVWTDGRSFAELAKQAQTADFRNDMDAIRAVPDDLLQQALLTTSSGSEEEAKEALDFVGKVLRPRVQRLGNTREALLLKQVVESCVESRSSTAFDAAMELQFLFNNDLMKRTLKEGISKNDRDDNPMAVIEQCYFGEERSSDDHLVGGFWLTVYRTALLVHSGEPFGPTLFALREAYAYTLAEETTAAETAAQWAFRRLDEMVSELAGEQRELVGQLFKAVAVAKGSVNDQAAEELYLKEAIKYAPQAGDLRADCFLDLSSLYQKQRRFKEALRTCEQGRRTPGIVDPGLKGMLETQWNALRADLEGTPERLKIDDRVLAEFGEPADTNSIFQDLMSKELSGEKPTDTELVRAIQLFRRSSEFMRANRLSEKTILNQHLLMLGLALSIVEPQEIPGCSPSEILAETELYSAAADEGQRLRLEMLRAEVLRRNG